MSNKPLIPLTFEVYLKEKIDDFNKKNNYTIVCLVKFWLQ